MKLISTLALTALAALSVGTSYAVPVVIDITGSTAFRASVHSALVAQFTGTTGYGYAISDTSTNGLAKTSQAIFKGQISSVDYIVRTSFNGSITGIAKVATGAADVAFIPTTATVSPTGVFNVAASATGAARFALSDVFQTASVYSGLTDTRVAVAGFKFLTNNGSALSGLSMTPQLYAGLYANGIQKLSVFTGIAADTSKVYPIGRDNGSGTRATVMAETGYGINKTVIQYAVTAGGNGTAITAIDFVPATSTGVDPTGGLLTQDPNGNDGNGGYTSGGKLVAALNGAATAVHVDGDSGTAAVTLVGYAGISDAGSQASMKYNGVDYSVAATQEGSYTLWGTSSRTVHSPPQKQTGSLRSSPTSTPTLVLLVSP